MFKIKKPKDGYVEMEIEGVKISAKITYKLILDLINSITNSYISTTQFILSIKEEKYETVINMNIYYSNGQGNLVIIRSKDDFEDDMQVIAKKIDYASSMIKSIISNIEEYIDDWCYYLEPVEGIDSSFKENILDKIGEARDNIDKLENKNVTLFKFNYDYIGG